MTFAEFAEVFAMLSLQLRANDTSEATARAYFQVLQDVNISLIKLAADVFARTADFFPRTSEWLNEATRIKKERVLDQRAVIRELHHAGRFLCNQCEDTRWIRDVETNRVRECPCAKDRTDEIVGRKALPEYVE